MNQLKALTPKRSGSPLLKLSDEMPLSWGLKLYKNSKLISNTNSGSKRKTLARLNYRSQFEYGRLKASYSDGIQNQCYFYNQEEAEQAIASFTGESFSYFMAHPPICYLKPCKSGSQIRLNPMQKKKLFMILKDYGIPIPRWIRQTIILTPSRCDWLRSILEESGCGFNWCTFGSDDLTIQLPRNYDHWATYLHPIFHQLVDRGHGNGT